MTDIIQVADTADMIINAYGCVNLISFGDMVKKVDTWKI